MSKQDDKIIPSTIDELMDIIDKRYQNDALKVDEIKTDKERHEYVGKLKLIREINVILGRTKR